MARGRPSKKQHIIAVASQLFAKYGYQGTSIDLVVREAQVSKPTVYNNFPSKQALLQAVISEQSALAETIYDQTLSTDTELFSDQLQYLYQQLIENPVALAIYKIYYGESHKLDQSSVILCQKFESKLTHCCEQILIRARRNTAQRLAIVSIYKNCLLNYTLSGEKPLNAAELKQQLQVLGLTAIN
ncbi:MAG: hypothetical protein OFPI_34540 [Osedax symbiont Rs2]|nr:MAG: hypothetical protein OFPI_34540 [Osedax symbiont Rs2]